MNTRGRFCESSCFYTYGLVEVWSNNSATMCQPGDSGAPVFHYDLYLNIYARGILTAEGSIDQFGLVPDPTDCFYTQQATIDFEDGVNPIYAAANT